MSLVTLVVGKRYQFWYNGRPCIVRVLEAGPQWTVCWCSLAVNRDGSMGAKRSYRTSMIQDIMPQLG